MSAANAKPALQRFAASVLACNKQRHSLASLLSLLLLGGSMAPMVQAASLANSLSYRIIPLNRAALPPSSGFSVDAINQARHDNQVVLYNSAFGSSTKTNPYGVEVIAEKAAESNGTPVYQVKQLISVWDCMARAKQNGDSAAADSLSQLCGNAPIGPNQIVLSATGEKRQWLLDTLRPGERFSLETLWQSQASAQVDVINPNAENNPRGRTYPGFRASQQLLVYTPEYGYSSTLTNEYGFEVTVRDGRVVEREGADSTIPADGYVLSGHGRMRDWLSKNAPVGAKITWDPVTGQISSVVDYSSYRFQLAQQLQELEPYRLKQPEAYQQVKEALAKADQLAAKDQTPQALAVLEGAQQTAQDALWQSLPKPPATAIKGVWHRPVEVSAEAVGKTLDRFKAAGLNAVFLETFFHGYPIFPSKTYEKYGIKHKQYPKFSHLDLLQTWIDEAHKRDMQVHAWFQTFYVGNTALGDGMAGVGPILEKYPQWANVQRSALGTGKPQPSTLESGHYFIDPANKEVQDFVLALIDEMLGRYNLDGLQLDYIRYPASFPPERFSYVATTWGYTPAASLAFMKRYGVDPKALSPEETPELWLQWQAFKEEQINEFVLRVHDKVVALNGKKTAHASHSVRKTSAPHDKVPVQLSAAIFPDPKGRVTKHQNWGLWKEEGWVDFLAPMTLTGSVKLVKQHTQTVRNTGKETIGVATGIFSPFNQLPADRMMEQLEASLIGGATGYVLFDSAHLGNEHYHALQLWQSSQRAGGASPSKLPGKAG